jgi:Na+-transporting methylmalonyl-CoA/oxaloacetate decarboxylase gamma subunit
MRELAWGLMAPVCLALGAVFLVIACLILMVWWLDSVRAIREFFAPLKHFPRPRFRLRTLLLFTALLSIVLKLGAHLNWLPQWSWIDISALLGIAVLAVLLILFLVQSYLSTFDRRPTIHAQPRIGVEEKSTDEEPSTGPADGKEPGHLRFRVRKRSILPFKW